jgi:hypothetical protein
MSINMEEKDLPCYECLCMPICRKKVVNKIIACDFVQRYMNKGSERNGKYLNSYRYYLLIRYLAKGFI